MPAPLIVHIVHRLDYGGLENGLVNLINGLPEQDYRHAVICLTDATDFRARIRRPDTGIHELHKRPGQDPGAYLRLWRLLRQLEPAIVHTRNTGVIDCQVVAWLAAVPFRVHGYHGWDVDDLTGTHPKRNLLRRLCDPFVDRYIVVSRQIGDWLANTLGVSPAKITHICNGVDAARFHSIRRREPGGDFVIGTVGRLQAVKDQRTLIDAVGRLVREQPPSLAARVRLVIGGDGPERPALEQAIRDAGLEGRATIEGWTDDVPALLGRLDLFVLSSLNEGISNTILEAMSSGLPVIATAVGGNPELVAEGHTGFLVPARDPERLAARLGEYLSSPELLATHGEAARRRIETEFSLRRMREHYDALYREALGHRRPSSPEPVRRRD